MRCVKCGCEMIDGAAFCPFCGEKVAQSGQESEAPIYQADVRRPLKSAGKLIVYRDRTEFVTSSVQRAIFSYTGLVSVRKGLLDNIEFITEDGRTETCPADKRCVHEALVYIEQASMSYRTQRQERLLSQGVRYSFPSNQGLMNSGVLNLSDEQAEFLAKSGKNETISYRDIKAVSMSGGMLTLSLFGGGSKAFTVSRELLNEVSSFVSDSVAPCLVQRKEALLAQGIYFSSDIPEGGTLDILADRAERRGRSGQAEDCVYFRNVRTASLYSGMLEFALTDGTSKSFPVEDCLSSDILAFIKNAIQPYVAARTVGFDVSFGMDERIEFNGERGVFHLIRQGGREITDERSMKDVIRCELTEDKNLTALGSVVSGGLGLIKNVAKAAGNQAGTAPAEEKIGGLVVTLTVCTDGDVQSQRVCFGRSSVGMGRTDKKYSQCMADWAGLSEYLKIRCPECELVEPVIPEPEPVLLEADMPAAGVDTRTVKAAEEDIKRVDVSTVSEPAPQRDDFGISGYIKGVSRFVETCATPMTIALQGDYGSGKSSVMGLLFDQMSGQHGKDMFWLNARQLSRGESAEALSELVGKTLIGLFSSGSDAANQAGSFLTGLAGLATGIIAGDTTIGKEIAGGMLNKNSVSAQMDLVGAFSRRVEEKIRGENKKIIFFITGLDQLDPAKAVDLLEAMQDYFECRGCVYVVSVNYRDILLGAQERYDQNRAKRFFDSVFKMTFRVPASSINVEGYAKGKLEDMGFQTGNGGDLGLYAALILSSVGRNMDAMDRLFVSFQLLKDMTGGDVFEDGHKRLTLFALLCMQTRFRDAYDYAIQRRDNVTPNLLAELCGESVQPWDQDRMDDEIAAYRDFGSALARIINLDGRMEISEAECQAFAAALELSSITSR